MAIAVYLRELLKEAVRHPGKSSAHNSDGLCEAGTSSSFLHSTHACSLSMCWRRDSGPSWRLMLSITYFSSVLRAPHVPSLGRLSPCWALGPEFALITWKKAFGDIIRTGVFTQGKSLALASSCDPKKPHWSVAKRITRQHKGTSGK